MSVSVAASSAQPAVAPSPLRPAALRTMRRIIHGRVLVDGDPGYDEIRGVHNTRFDRRPGAIVRPADALDVSRAVLLAQEMGMDVVVKSGGHSVGGLSTTDGGLLIDMRTLNGVDIDPIRWDGSAQGGVTAGEYTHAAHEHGFATPFGDALTVGLGGLTLGGGIGWLTRKYGMTIDNLLEADLVTADGQLRTVNADADPDLFWAIRGGGGNFGIVTRFRYRLHPVNMVTGGALFLPLTREVLRGLVDASMEASDELTQISIRHAAAARAVRPRGARRDAGRHRHAGPRRAARRRRRRHGPVPRPRDAVRRHGRPDAVPGDVQVHRGRRRGRPGLPPVVDDARPGRHGDRRDRRAVQPARPVHDDADPRPRRRHGPRALVGDRVRPSRRAT